MKQLCSLTEDAAMLRSAVVLATLLIFPGIGLAQEEPAGEGEEVHTVERGESLWNLARRYYEDPFQWRQILEANDAQIEDPHWIYPGQEFAIPGRQRTVTGVEVDAGPPTEEAPEEEAREEEPVAAERAGTVYPGPDDRTVFSDPAREDTPAPEDRTAFYGPLQEEQRLESGGVLAGEAVERLEVSRSDFYSAPWRVTEERRDQVAYPGQVVGWTGTQVESRERETVNPYDRIEIRWTGEAPPAEGERIQMVRVARSEEDFGSVIRPTGLARVVERSDSAVVAIVQGAFTRPRIGDYALTAPDFPLEPGRYAEEAAGDELAATLAGFAVPRRIQQIGDVAFLAAGARDGIRVGDVFSIEVTGGGGWSPEEAVRLQVVRVFDDRSSVRVTHITSPVFRPGQEVRRTRAMP